jgi:uncharacterized protein (DUF433 family)
LKKAQILLDEHHPFSTKQFLTDGKEILYQVSHEDNSVKLMNILNNQYEFQAILEQFLQTGIEFSSEDLACRWWPSGEDGHIVLDPQRYFGQPVINEIGILTSTLYQAYNTEKDFKIVADWYEVSTQFVKIAVEYEESLSA